MEEKAFEAFCREINTSKSDVFVIMAHKAVRLFQILIDQNHIEKHIENKTIISSHSLDFDCSYLLGKKITIIDDILISGTSIASTVHKLIKVGVPKNNINIITLAIDRYYQGMNFNDELSNSTLHCKTYLEDSSCIELSYTISKIFSYYGMPYDIDYPNYVPIELSSKKVNILFNDFFWNTNRITNQEQKNGNIDTFVLFPNDCVRQLLWKRIGVNLEKTAHTKIRVYVNNFPSKKKECNVVPMFLFDETSKETIDYLYNMYKPKTKEIILQNDTYISKMRYLEFYFAHQLYLIFKEISSLSNDINPTEESVNMLFGPITGETISSELNNISNRKDTPVLIESTNVIDNIILIEFFSSKFGEKYKSKIKQIISSGTNYETINFNYVLFAPFLWWYDTKEIPVRNDLAKNKYHFIENYSEINNKLLRLNSGFSLFALKTILNEVFSDYNDEQFISIFIDQAIDEGIIVPTIYHSKKGNYLCRAYRHGEDLPFGLQDECRLLLFLKNLGESIPNIISSRNNGYYPDGIATISFEKMIVLFFQMGIEQGDIFNRFLGFDNINILKPFLSMHGAVEGYVDPQYIKENGIQEHFYSEALENGDQYITWLTKWLIDNGFIEKIEDMTIDNHDRIVYVINSDCIDNYLIKNERNCISPTIRRSISNLAYMISTWYNTMSEAGGKDKFKEDAIALSSCSNPYVYASAIATEIHYFSKFWCIQVCNAFERSNNTSNLLTKLVETDKDKTQTTNVGQALYSGRNKVKLYNEKRASTVVNEVSNILDGGGINLWTKLWDTVLSGECFYTKDISTYTNQVIGFLYFYSACYDCLKSEAFWRCGEKPAQYEEYKRLYQEQCQKCTLLKKELFSKLDEICDLNKFVLKKEKFEKFVGDTINDSEDVVNNIELQIENSASNYTIRYKSSLVFEVNSFDRSQNNDKIMKVWNQLEENVDKTQLNIVVFPDDLCDSNYMKYGIFYGSSSYKKNTDNIKAGKILRDIFVKLCEEFDGKVYEIRAMLIPDTPPGRMFKHNVQRNIDLNIREFVKNIVNLLSNYYISDTKQQLVVATTDYVDPTFYELIKKMQWDNRKDYKPSSKINVFSKIKIYSNNYIHPNAIQNKDVAYSVVKIICGDNIGTGFILRTHDRTVCVTCNHVLLYATEQEPQAISVYNDEISFSLKPIKEIKIVVGEEILPAADELAILELRLQGRIPFDMSSVLSIEDLNCNINAHYNSSCICCGYPDGEQCWSDSLRLIGSGAKGYCQTKINNSDNPVEEGYSGGIIVLENNQSSILGMHVGRRGDNNGRMIPCNVILNEIERNI